MQAEARGEVAQAISDTFRTYGFEGASLSRLTEATGLIKASLYHRFPEGKQQMAEMALAETDRIFAAEVLAPIDETGDPRERVERVGQGLLRFYANGRKACLLDTLSLAAPSAEVQRHLRKTLAFWTTRFARIAGECGMEGERARVAAQDAIAALEGGLVLARVSGHTQAFQRAVASLPRMLGLQ